MRLPVVIGLLVLAACAETAYPADLALCTEASSTLCQSIACENQVRAAKGRPLRPVPASCADAGKDGAP